MSADPVRRIADAVLYEGYVLWPYRRSALKNRQRFTWGGVYPRGWPEGPSSLRAECLLEAAEPEVEVTARFLQVVERGLVDSAGDPVDELVVAGERHLAWEEATEREVALAAPGRTAIELPGSEDREAIAGAGGPAGAIVRRTEALEGTLAAAVEPLGPGLHRVTVEVANAAPWDGGDRDAALRRTLCSTHLVLHSPEGAFVSPTDPPEALREAVEARAGDGLWPVLVGEPGDRSTMLAAPIILEDYPRVAPESPGDLFDGGEIDQLLTLNILALTDEEKAEMRDSDPRAREILERTEGMSREELMRLHGTIRELRPAG